MPEILKDLSTDALLRANIANLYASSPLSINLPQAEVHKAHDLSWCITGILLPQCNIVFGARLKPELVDDTIKTIVEKARIRNVPLRWLVGQDTEPADLGDRLLSYGFTTSGLAPLMAIDLLSMKTDLAGPSNLVITEIRDNDSFETWYRVFAQGFGIPRERELALPRWYGAVRNLDLPFHFYLAFQNGKPVAISQLFLAEGVAGLYCVATIPEARKQGIGYAVSLKPLQDAFDMGYRVGTLQSSKMGKPIYSKMGFTECGQMAAYQWMKYETQ